MPFIMGDGLRTFGRDDLSVNFHVTQHQHPIAGGFLEQNAPELGRALCGHAYRGRSAAHWPQGGRSHHFNASPERSPCDYLVIERAKASRQALDYIRTLPLEPLSVGDGLEVYVVRADPP